MTQGRGHHPVLPFPNPFPLGCIRYSTTRSPLPRPGWRWESQGTLFLVCSSQASAFDIQKPRKGSLCSFCCHALSPDRRNLGWRGWLSEARNKGNESGSERRKIHVNISKIFFCHTMQWFDGSMQFAKPFPCCIHNAHSPTVPSPLSFRTQCSCRSARKPSLIYQVGPELLLWPPSPNPIHKKCLENKLSENSNDLGDAFFVIKSFTFLPKEK